MNPNHKPFACALPAGTTPFMWLIAGPQKAAMNDPKFNEVKAAGPEDQAIYAAIAKGYFEVTLIKKEKDQ